MAHQIIWSPIALADLDAIGEFIARDSEFYAARVVQRIFDAAERLQAFPKMGRRVPEFNEDDSIREVLAYSYRIIYRLKGEKIEIAAVVHMARQLPEALGDRPV